MSRKEKKWFSAMHLVNQDHTRYHFGFQSDWKQILELSRQKVHKGNLRSTMHHSWLEEPLGGASSCHQQVFHVCLSDQQHQPKRDKQWGLIELALWFYSKLYKKLLNQLKCHNILSAAPKWKKYCSSLEQKQTTADTNKCKMMPSTSEALLSLPLSPDQ